MTAPMVGLDPSRPFTRTAARAAGITDAELMGWDYVRVHRGVYRHRDCLYSDRVRVEAALLLHPFTAYASHASAAKVYGLPPPPLPGEHITVAHRDDRRRRDVFRHHLAVPGADVRVVKGVRWHGTSPERLLAASGRAASRVRRLALRAAALVRSEVDSPMETRVRLLIVMAGRPEPVVNLKIRWEDGRVRFRFDLCCPELKLVVEYDGQQHRSDLDQWTPTSAAASG